MAHQHSFNLESFNFHNTKEKIQDRERMLDGQWPKTGCTFCQDREKFGAPSDRTIFNDWPTYRPPPELDHDLNATSVTPRILQLYFGNTCNLKCIYCSATFSSKINQENRTHGYFSKDGVIIPGYNNYNETLGSAMTAMFDYLQKNIKHIDHIMIMGGEPFIQKETLLMLDFLESVDCSHLNLHITSNCMANAEKFQYLLSRFNELQIQQIILTASVDCWGAEAEYIRNGLDLSQFKQNFEYALYDNDNVVLNIHTTLSALNTKSLPELVQQINDWSQHKNVYWSLKGVDNPSFLNYKIFGSYLLDLGLSTAIELFDTQNDIEKIKFKQSYLGIIEELKNSVPNLSAQNQLKVYLEELDRRRGTDYKILFPELAKILMAPRPGLEPGTK